MILLLCMIVFSHATDPLSTQSPIDLGFPSVVRTTALPGSFFTKGQVPLPTNSWFQDLVLGEGVGDTSNVFQIPYVVQPVNFHEVLLFCKETPL
jgi:hypothetical protein